ncbi:FxLYD domain-containing protein, partial [Halobium palmae]
DRTTAGGGDQTVDGNQSAGGGNRSVGGDDWLDWDGSVADDSAESIRFTSVNLFRLADTDQGDVFGGGGGNNSSWLFGGDPVDIGSDGRVTGADGGQDYGSVSVRENRQSGNGSFRDVRVARNGTVYDVTGEPVGQIQYKDPSNDVATNGTQSGGNATGGNVSMGNQSGGNATGGDGSSGGIFGTGEGVGLRGTAENVSDRTVRAVEIEVQLYDDRDNLLGTWFNKGEEDTIARIRPGNEVPFSVLFEGADLRNGASYTVSADVQDAS